MRAKALMGLAMAREEPLFGMAQEVSAAKVLPLDAMDGAKVFAVLQPRILVVCAGVFPPAARRLCESASSSRRHGTGSNGRPPGGPEVFSSPLVS